MTIYFSATTCSFYNTDVYPENNLPEDCVIVEEETYKSLMEQQNAGFVIVPDSDGNPSVMPQSCGACHCTVHEKTVATKDQLGHVKIDCETLDLNEDGELTVIGGAGGGLEIGDIGFAPLGIDETQNKRRYLNGQVISQSQFESFTNKVKSAIALYPNLSATEENWQAEVTASVLGQCGKFVVDNIAGTIRLPKVVNINGLQDLALLGGIKAESLPNITGTFGASMTQGNFLNFGTGAFGSYEDTAVSQYVPSVGAVYDSNNRWDFNASRSSSAYQNNAPVQQEAVQYPYFIQVATGTEETLPAISEYKVNTPFFFGMSQWFESDPKNASWLISNGNFHKGATYTDMYKQLQVELNDSLNVGDTVEIDGRTFVKHGLPVKLSTDTYDDYDFVVNTSDETFRVPLKNGKECLPDYDAGVNISTYTYATDGFVCPSNGVINAWVGGAANVGGQIMLNGAAYTQLNVATAFNGQITLQVRTGDVIKIQNPMTTALGSGKYANKFFPYKGNGSLYFYVGDTVQDASLINAGHVLTDLATKTNSVQAAAASMPSGRYIDLTFGVSGSTYTAPANGWFSAYCATGSSTSCYLQNNANGINAVGTVVERLTDGRCCIPANKGDIISFYYNGMNTEKGAFLRFIYAEGDK